MSKILFGALLAFTLLQSSSFAAAPLTASSEAPKDLCEQAMIAIHQWAAQLEQDATDSKTTGECLKELGISKQLFPKFSPGCALLPFSKIPAETQKLWLNASPWGTAKPTPDVKLASFGQAFRLEMNHFIESKCKKKSGE